MLKEREKSIFETPKVYPRFEEELQRWVKIHQLSTESPRKIVIKTRQSAADTSPATLMAGDIIAFLHKWYDSDIQGESDPAREALRGAKRKLGIQGEKRPQTKGYFYTLEEAKSILWYIYRNWSHIKSVEGK